MPTAPAAGGVAGGAHVDDVQVLSQDEGIGVVATTRSRHLFVARLVSRVALGCGGSPAGVPEPFPPYSSARPNALWPISWMAIFADED